MHARLHGPALLPALLATGLLCLSLGLSSCGKTQTTPVTSGSGSSVTTPATNGSSSGVTGGTDSTAPATIVVPTTVAGLQTLNQSVNDALNGLQSTQTDANTDYSSGDGEGRP